MCKNLVRHERALQELDQPTRRPPVRRQTTPPRRPRARAKKQRRGSEVRYLELHCALPLGQGCPEGRNGNCGKCPLSASRGGVCERG